MKPKDEPPITFISGTRKGIGRYLAQHYLHEGHIVLGCSRQQPEWDHRRYTHYLVDICEEKAVKKMFSSIRQQFGRLDHLLNNAGVGAMNHALLTPVETVERVLAVNVTGTFLLCREGARLMQGQRYGRIVNFGSVVTALQLEGEAIYAASKAAVLSLTQTLARELAPWEITVNAVAPTPVETDMLRAVAEEKLDALIQRQAIKRMGAFADVSNVVDFFLREESNFITGQTLYLGGVI